MNNFPQEKVNAIAAFKRNSLTVSNIMQPVKYSKDNNKNQQNQLDEEIPVDKNQDIFNKVQEYQMQAFQEKQEDETQLPQNVFFLLFLSVVFSSFKGPLFITIQDNAILRSAWRQFFLSLLYIPVIYQKENEDDVNQYFSYSLRDKYKAFMITCVSQSVMLQFFEKYLGVRQFAFYIYKIYSHFSCLIVLQFIVILGKKIFSLEIIGITITLLCQIFVITEDQQQKVSSYEQIIFGDIMALVGSAASLIYAHYIFQLQNICPDIQLTTIIRLTVTLILIITSLLFESTHLGFSHNGLFHCFSFYNLFLLLLNALLTGFVVHYIEMKLEKVLDPLSQKAATFFEPLMGTLIAYFFNLQRLPSLITMLCLVIFIFSMNIIQKGRTESEAQEFEFDTKENYIEMQSLDYIPQVYNKPGDRIIQQATLYQHNPVRRNTLKISYDMNMEH